MSETQHEVWTQTLGLLQSFGRGTTGKSKIITVKPKGKLSLQYHHKRSEHWYIIQGRGKFTLGDAVWIYTAGDSADIPVGTTHRIENVGEEDLIFVEVQTGESFDENDIVRVEDDYGR
jgi:mannose-6-phosphate isomerase-like protein (cupin superfamily)